MNDFLKYGYARYNDVTYPFIRIIGENIFLMDVVSKRGFDTIVKRVFDVKVIKYPNDTELCK